MRRWAFRLAEAVSLLPCATTAGLWYRSFSREDDVFCIGPHSRHIMLHSFRGTLTVIACSPWPVAEPLDWLSNGGHEYSDFRPFVHPATSRFLIHSDRYGLILYHGPLTTFVHGDGSPMWARFVDMGQPPPSSSGFVGYSRYRPPPGTFELVGQKPWSDNDHEVTFTGTQLWVPMRLLVVVTATLPFICAARIAVVTAIRRNRRRGRRCGACGYDLRASRDHCPECGTVVPLEAKK
jgi:hypothetical protein